MNPLLEIKNIETYYDLIYAIRGTSLTVDEGTITAILGTNGAGKSTILKTVMGLIEDQPDKGTIEFKGRRIDRMDTEKIVRLGISYVPEGREVFEELSVKENLLMGAYAVKEKETQLETLEYIFELFPRLEERKKQLAGTMSGGERKMLAIARGMMSNPTLMLVDEPSLGLQPNLTYDVFSALLELRKKGVTILLVEQNVNATLDITDRAYILEQGKIVMSGPSREMKANEHVQNAYLGI